MTRVRWHLVLAGLWGVSAQLPLRAAEILADPPSALSVTVYRAPLRNAGLMDLNALEGFALISESRLVHLPAGLSRLRFEGVADGIEAVSAIVTGLPAGVLEKNRDAKLLSPAALVAAALGHAVELERTDRKTGRTQRLPATILSDADGGVVFATRDGVEALRCSGLPESFVFDSVEGLAARPTLSVLVNSDQPVTRTVTLSYLARGFDWGAAYTASLSADGRSMNLGAWVTLANGNGGGFPAARVQVVAGRLNRARSAVLPIELGSRIVAQCWPRGSTSEASPVLVKAAQRRSVDSLMRAEAAMPMAALASVAQMKTEVQQEQLGDLKLYRVPDRTTLASRQSKQVRLLDRSGIPVTPVYASEVSQQEDEGGRPARRLLRTINDTAHHLGLPLPAGAVQVFGQRRGQALLESETQLRDVTTAEELELDLGESPDVQVTVRKEPKPARDRDAMRVTVSNARAQAIAFELRLALPQGGRVLRADHPQATRNGRPLFKMTVPANGTATVRYELHYPV